MSQILQLTALVYEGPMARSYLALLRAAGYRLERVIVMLQKRDAANGGLLPNWLPQPLLRALARRVQDARMNHWPRTLVRQHAALCADWFGALGQTYGFDPVVYQALIGKINYRDYADTVDEVLTDGLSDPALLDTLRSLPARSTLLFTGGGMVPAGLLSLPNCRFLHVHPGVLPNVRGADGLLWSVLLRGTPGATAFYMSPGLDTGDIVHKQNLALPALPASFAALDAATRYRMLYAFLDPVLRAVLLLQVLERSPADLYDLPAQAQTDAQGTTFHFMNKAMRVHALERLQRLSPKQRTT